MTNTTFNSSILSSFKADQAKTKTDDAIRNHLSLSANLDSFLTDLNTFLVNYCNMQGLTDAGIKFTAENTSKQAKKLLSSGDIEKGTQYINGYKLARVRIASRVSNWLSGDTLKLSFLKGVSLSTRGFKDTTSDEGFKTAKVSTTDKRKNNVVAKSKADKKAVEVIAQKEAIRKEVIADIKKSVAKPQTSTVLVEQSETTSKLSAREQWLEQAGVLVKSAEINPELEVEDVQTIIDQLSEIVALANAAKKQSKKSA